MGGADLGASKSEGAPIMQRLVSSRAFGSLQSQCPSAVYSGKESRKFLFKKKKLNGTGSQNPHVGMSPKCVPRDSKFLPSVMKGKRMAHNLGSPLCLNIQEIRSDYSYFKD